LTVHGSFSAKISFVDNQPLARIRAIFRPCLLFFPIPAFPSGFHQLERNPIRALEAAQAASRTRLEALFQSLLYRAFNGEL
jgi:hypothetical protein